METTPLGTTGEDVSALCLGTMYFGSRTDPETSRDILDAYYEAGGRFLDTANKYATWLDDYDEPKSEPLLGEWMAERGNRDELFVATKVGFPYPGVERGLSPEQIAREVEGSLDRLDVDTIDLLYAHGDDYDTPQETYMEAFDRLVEDGRSATSARVTSSPGVSRGPTASPPRTIGRPSRSSSPASRISSRTAARTSAGRCRRPTNSSSTATTTTSRSSRSLRY